MQEVIFISNDHVINATYLVSLNPVISQNPTNFWVPIVGPVGFHISDDASALQTLIFQPKILQEIQHPGVSAH